MRPYEVGSEKLEEAEKAIALVGQIDYDFSTTKAAFVLEAILHYVARAKQFDDTFLLY
ncbi:MAG: hypothetical protein ACXV5I_07850 [Halobacteriota archaeon]